MAESIDPETTCAALNVDNGVENRVNYAGPDSEEIVFDAHARTAGAATSVPVVQLLIKSIKSYCLQTNGGTMSRGVLVEDSTFIKLSPALEEIALSLNDDVSHHDQLIALSTVIMGEVGYYVDANDDKLKNHGSCPKSLKKISLSKRQFDPREWRASGVYEIPMINRMTKVLNVKLEAIAVGDLMILNVSSVNKSVKTRSMAVETMAYVNPYSSDLAGKFLDLKRLSHRFKDTLTTPIRDEILNAAKVTNPSLQGLPIEIQQKIFSFLDVKSASQLKFSCKQFYRIL